MARYKDDRRYLVTGALLNRIERDLATARLIPGDGLEHRVLPGQGTEVWLAGAGRAARPPWDLEPVEDGVVCHVGTIIEHASDLTKTIPIAGADAVHAMADGHVLYLKLSGLGPTTASLVVGSTWPGHPSSYEVEGETVATSFVTHYYPLWQFTETAGPGHVPVAPDLFARRLVGHHHLLMGLGAYLDQESPSTYPVTVPVLVPFPAALD